ncbi:hypothetical protein RchiOBHm_Chr4g0445951 [Rosa chinensis]|uniref:Uncharacterized protein n=1 Tax=Rosa chinensis TaxID=74649 RepID=A0A2P6R4R1_ROSCH|nr:hypothetical protein RchiOBHm_Chr4g0445951 [Rosa chinensis]
MYTSSFSLVIGCKLCQAHPKSQPAKLEHLMKTLTPSQSLVLYFSQRSNLRSVVRWLRPSLCLLLFFNLGQSIQLG